MVVNVMQILLVGARYQTTRPIL